MFDSTKSERIEFDASNLIIKACYNQCHEENWHFIAYLSRKLSSAKQNYDVHDKKLLIIITALKNWKVYAEETSKLTIFTNYKNLLHFITIKQLNKRQVKWLKLLRQYKFRIQYTLEKNNDRTNALNRRSDHMKSKRIFDHNILKINKNESLSTNTNEINATLRILRDDEKQYSVIKKKTTDIKRQNQRHNKKASRWISVQTFWCEQDVSTFTTQLRVLQHETTRRNIHQEMF